MTSQDRIDLLSDLFQEHYGFIVEVARRYAPTADMVDDVTQQVYLDFVCGCIEHDWQIQTPEPLLYQITKSKALMLWRDRRRRKAFPIDDVLERLNGDEAPNDADECRVVAEEIKALKHCLDQLSPKARDFILRRYHKNESMKSIAEIESIKTPTLYRFFRQIRQKLRTCINQTLNNDETVR